MRPVYTLLLALLSVLWTTMAHAEPRFAIREGQPCSACHVNVTGGGMRTPYGVAFAQATLPTTQVQGAFDPYLGGSVAVGANLRLAHFTRLAAETRLQGTKRNVDGSNSFEIPEANLYLRLEPVPEHVALYIDETVGPEGASSREAFALVSDLPGDLYVKAGRFMLPYGLKVLDDEAFIRQETGFTYANQDLGVEVGTTLDPVVASVALSNGSLGGGDPNPNKQVTASVTAHASWARLGFSVARNDASVDDFELKSTTAGAHAGLKVGRLYQLGEADIVAGKTANEAFNQWILYSESRLEAWKGWYLTFVFEAFDPLWSLPENERDRFVIGTSWFPIQGLEIRADYRLNRDIPQRIEANADEVLLEIHGFL